MDGSSKGPADQPPSTWAIFYSMEVAMQHTSGSYYRNSIARIIARISGVFYWRMGTGSLWRVVRFLIGGHKLWRWSSSASISYTLLCTDLLSTSSVVSCGEITLNLRISGCELLLGCYDRMITFTDSFGTNISGIPRSTGYLL
jgi:hypothetical protein